MMPNPPPRTCIEEPTFAAQKAALGLTVERLDEILEGLLLRIARFPEQSYVIPGTGVSSEISNPFPNAPQVWVLYVFDDEATHLLWVELY